jgi:2-keto-4-pentenoate hydratase/2-oxohepta-3-ene-1,7-dioic acid hydratase in catechol pathway
VTARDIQRRHGGQWFKGKSIDATCPIGPWLVTADELAPDEPIEIHCTINGEVIQQATTDAMIFSIPALVASLAHAMTLHAGDIILTGTPDGVGYARTPPRFLRPGDEVVVSSRQLGELRNRVVERTLTSYEPSPGGAPR